MIHTLIFGGTTEGRQAVLAEPDAVVCVTSPYARSLLPPGTNGLVGSLDRAYKLLRNCVSSKMLSLSRPTL